MTSKDVRSALLHFRTEDIPEIQYINRLLYQIHCSIYPIERFFDFMENELLVKYKNSDKETRNQLKLMNDNLSFGLFDSMIKLLDNNNDWIKFQSNPLIFETGWYASKKDELLKQLKKSQIQTVFIEKKSRKLVDLSTQRNSYYDNPNFLY